MSFLAAVTESPQIVLKQRREAIELLGVEMRNTYDILLKDGQSIGSTTEVKSSFFAMLVRQLFRHWRTFSLSIVDAQGQEVIKLHHPFRFYFQRLEVTTPDGRTVGIMEKQFSILRRVFSITTDPLSLPIMMSSKMLSLWAFPFTRGGREVASISKQWGGALKEMFLDADTFGVQIIDPSLTADERILLLAAAIFIDINYFEGNNGFSPLDFVGR